MSLKLGNIPIAGISQNKICNAHFLLEPIWSDHLINDISFLRADTFSWQSGDVYVTAYNHLVQDIQGITAETETIGSYTVIFYRATDGHKVALADQEQTVLNIYNTYGIAWYYILDTTNTQFKLPRTKYGFEGLRTNVGDKIDESLPNIIGSFTSDQWQSITCSGAFSLGNVSSGRDSSDNNGTIRRNVKFDASHSSSTYQDSAPVQERATQMYLYFYVGDYTQTAIEQTAGLNSELFNGKADNNLANVSNAGTSLGAGWAMPSDKYINLTLGASGSYYKAPANGWVSLRATQDATSGWVRLSNTPSFLSSWKQPPSVANFVIETFIPIRANGIFRLEYSGVTFSNFRFVYAVGSESEAS